MIIQKNTSRADTNDAGIDIKKLKYLEKNNNSKLNVRAPIKISFALEAIPNQIAPIFFE